MTWRPAGGTERRRAIAKERGIATEAEASVVAVHGSDLRQELVVPVDAVS